MLKKTQNPWSLLRRRHCFSTKPKSSENIPSPPDPTETLCKIISSTPLSALDAALDHSAVRLTPDVADRVLHRFRNAGLLAYRFFRWSSAGISHSVRAHHAVIESLAKIRQYELMWEVVTSMKPNHLLNVETFCIIMRKYARARKTDEAVYCFNVMEKHGVAQNLAALNGLLSALCKSKSVRKAQEVFDSLKTQPRFVPDSKTYSILLEGWGREPNLPMARKVFREMVDGGGPAAPDAVTYGIMVDVLCKAGQVDEAVRVARGTQPSPFVYSVLIHSFGAEGRTDEAVAAFREMERRGVAADVVAYNALVGAFVRAERMEDARGVLEEMRVRRVRPNSRTMNVILSGLIGRGQAEEAARAFRKMVRVCEADADTYTMMIKMFCGNGDVEMGMKMWRYMKRRCFVPGMHTFSVLINGLSEQGDSERACVLMEEMIENGIRPAGVTFGRLRHLLIKEGRDDVLKFLQHKMDLLVKEPLG